MKAKTHSGAKKRFRFVASGSKVKVRRGNRSHILTKFTSKRKRHLRAQGLVDQSDLRSVQRMLRGC